MATVPLNPQAPQFSLQIGGKDLPKEAALDLQSVTVEEDVDAPGMFTFQLANWDAQRDTVKWSDDAMFAEGGEVLVRMGYGTELRPLMTGDITGLEPSFAAKSGRVLIVRGYDRRHRLLRARRSRSFSQVSDSDVASQLAGDAGLTANTTDSAVVHEYLFQNNQSDLDFLEARARAIGYEVSVDDKTLFFRPRQIAGSEALTLSLRDDLIEFHPRLSVLSQFSSVTLRGWDPAAKDSVQSEAGAGDELAVMGTTAGPASGKKAFGEAATSIADRPIRTQAEADRLTRGIYNEMALDYITGEGVAIGRADLRAGIVVRMKGLGERFSGLYYVTATVHSWTPRQGYRTAFSVKRNAS